MIGLIAAYSKNKVIGHQGKIPWKIPGEQLRFKKLTTNNIIIIGRKSYEEIGHPLPNRFNIVVSKSKCYKADNCFTVSSLTDALTSASALTNYKHIFIAGGASIYQQAISFVDKMYITLIDIYINGDTFFPDFDHTQWIYKKIRYFNDNIPYIYLTYERKSK